MGICEQLRENWLDILAKDWNGKPVWEYVREGELTAAPAFEGSQYKSASTKIMYVGRALNGWVKMKNCNSLEQTIDEIMGQDSRFDTFVTEEYVSESGVQYSHKSSKFWRLIKQILECVDESCTPTDDTWYNDTKSWHEKFVWANLFCVSPPKGGNPEDGLMKQSINSYVKLIDNYISLYTPEAVVFCTDENWFIPWKREPSFRDLLDSYEGTGSIGNTIVGRGTIGKTKVIVSKRPDSRGTTYDEVRQMAIDIADEIKRK